MLPAIHRYARLGVMASLVCATAVACLTGSSTNPPQAEAPAPADPNAASPAADANAPTTDARQAIASPLPPDPPDTADNGNDAVADNGNSTGKADQPAAKADESPVNDTNTVQLSPYNLALPRPPEDATDAVRGFNVAAVRAVQRVYREDADDPSVLLALQDQLTQRQELRALLPIWQEPLAAAMARATTLQALGPTLRSLRTAMGNAYFDERLHLYRDVDAKGCEAAFNTLPTADDTLLNFVVTVEPIGTYPLSKFRTFCAESRATSMKERTLPGHPAPQPVMRLVKRLYNQAHLGGVVRKVSVVKPWQRDAEQRQTTLHAVVGVMRDGDSGDQCIMAEVSVVKPLHSSEPPVISEVGEREAILCQQLK